MWRQSLLSITVSVSHRSSTIATTRVLILSRLLSVVTDGSIKRHARVLVGREITRARIFVSREVAWSRTLVSLLRKIGTIGEDRLVHRLLLRESRRLRKLTITTTSAIVRVGTSIVGIALLVRSLVIGPS